MSHPLPNGTKVELTASGPGLITILGTILAWDPQEQEYIVRDGMTKLSERIPASKIRPA